MTIPKPTEKELQKWNKSDYFVRLLSGEYDKKLKISSNDLSDWIHYNYENVIHTGNELNYKQYQKLK